MTQITSVPKNMSRVREEVFGLPVKYVIVLVVTAFMALAFSVLFLAGYAVFGLLLFGLLYVFFMFARSPAVLNRSWLKYLFIIGGIRGENITSKYMHTETIVKSIVPIEKVHPGGLIQFSNKAYGRLIVVDPPRISDDDLDVHIQKIMNIVDSLHGELIMKTYAVSIPSSVRPAEKAILKLMNESSKKSEEEEEHLYSLYKDAQEHDNQVIQWRFYVFVGLGKYDNIESANIAEMRYLPGFTTRMAKSDINIRTLKSFEEIVAAYRSMFQLNEVN